MFNAIIKTWKFWSCRILVKQIHLFLWLSTQTIHQKVPCLSGQLLIQSHLLLHQKLRLSLIISKGREEFGFVGHTKVNFHACWERLTNRCQNVICSCRNQSWFLLCLTNLESLHIYSSSECLFILPGYGFHEDGLKVVTSGQ